MIPGNPERPRKVVVFQGKFIHCQRGGFWTQKAGLRERVKRGQTLGTVSDFFGEVVETIKAPYDGIVGSKRSFATIQPGEWTVQFGGIVKL